MTDILFAPQLSPHSRQLRRGRRAVEAFLAEKGRGQNGSGQGRNGLCIIGPQVNAAAREWFPESAERDHLLDLSGIGLGTPGRDPRRRSLTETWYTTAKAGAEAALDAMQAEAPAPWNALIGLHRTALMLRLKTELSLRLRCLEIVDDVVRTTGARAVHLIEGDEPLDDLEAHLRANGLTVTHELGPASRAAATRFDARRRGPADVADAWGAFAAAVARWSPGAVDFSDKALVVGDLRRKTEFRHSQTVRALLGAAAADGCVLIQPYTRLTSNVVRAAGTASGLGARTALIRQPQAVGASPSLAGVRTLLLNRIDKTLGTQFTVGQRAAILEGCGVFVASSLAPGLALAQGLSEQFAVRRPRFVASVPLGSPFGGLVVSAARAADIPTVELQTLMIGTSDRDPMPVAERVGVLDDSQRDIFQTRFGVSPERFIFAGHVDIGQAERPGPHTAPPRSVIFASQPLDGVSAAALEILAAACDALGDVTLSVSPHPDETAADIATSRAILSRWPKVAGRVLPAGATNSALLDHAVLCTVVSNVAIRAAQRGIPVLIVNPGVDLPVDFAGLGVALAAETVGDSRRILRDFFAHGPATKRLEASREAYFHQNPQLMDRGAARRVVAAMAPEDSYWRGKRPAQSPRSHAELQSGERP